MEKKYKILHIFSGYGGGISSLILNLIENSLENFDFDLLAFSYKGGEKFLDKISKCNVRYYTMPRPKEKGYKYFLKSIDDLIKENKYDAIHCHIAGIHALPFEYIAKKNNVNLFILHAHTTSFDSRLDRNRILYRIGQFINYKNSDCYMTCSDMAANYVYGEKYLKKRNAYLIPNGITKEKYEIRLTESEKEAYRKELNIDKTVKVFLHVGRFSLQKNHEFIIKIAKQLKNEIDNFIILLVGDGELVEMVENKIKTYNLDNKIKILGRRFDISKLMQFSDCMILPSFYEGLPTVAVECQSSGTEILLSNKITKQSDLGLDLVKFLSIESVDEWVKELKRNEFKHKNIDECIEIVEKKGFTANMAGNFYCKILKQNIENLYK